MSWYSKVVWSEGLFLRPHHLQQSDRYLEHLVEGRTGQVTPYPWGFSDLEIDRDLAQQSKFGLRRAAGIMPDGTPFRICRPTAAAAAIAVPEACSRACCLAVDADVQPNTREVDDDRRKRQPLRRLTARLLIDSTSKLHDRRRDRRRHAALQLRRSARRQSPASSVWPCARIIEVSDKSIVFDERFAPPVLLVSRIQSVDRLARPRDRLDRDQARGTGALCLRSALRRRPAERRLFHAANAQPPDSCAEAHARIALRASGAALCRTAAACRRTRDLLDQERRARDYPAYDHDDLDRTFAPVLADIQRFLSVDISRAIRLDIIEQGAERLHRHGHATATCSAMRLSCWKSRHNRPLTEIQLQFPALFKIGPNTKMNDIVHAHLPGISLVHVPTPPAQIRAISDHVYFYLDRKSPLWPEFSTASGIGMHFSGDWPGLELDLWAVKEDGE